MPVSLLRGVIAATATPVLPDFTPDLQRLVPHLRYLLEHGCDAINLLGTTGEANSFGLKERIALMAAVKAEGLPLDRFMVGTGVCSLSETVELTRAASELGYAGALVLPPFFYPGIEPQALIGYVDALIREMRESSLRIYLYHIPQNTGVPWPVEVVAELARRHPRNLKGIKDSSGDLAYSRGVVAAVPGFDVFPSSEGVLARAAAEGFAGCISASVNLTSADSQRAWSQGETEEGSAAVERASTQRSALAQRALVASIKAALAMRYADRPWARTCPPLSSLSTDQEADLRERLKTAGLSFAER